MRSPRCYRAVQVRRLSPLLITECDQIERLLAQIDTALPRAGGSCTRGSEPLKVTELLQRTIYTGELVVQVRTETVDHCDDCNRNAGCNQPVFDCGRARLVIQKTRKKLAHRNTSAKGRLEDDRRRLQPS